MKTFLIIDRMITALIALAFMGVVLTHWDKAVTVGRGLILMAGYVLWLGWPWIGLALVAWVILRAIAILFRLGRFR